MTVKIKTILAMLCLLCCNVQSAAAERLQLAELEAERNGEPVKFELWGEKLSGGYADDLLLLMKNGDKEIITAYKPPVDGGYNCFLEAVQLKEGDKNILLSIGRGNWRAGRDFLLLDFKDAKNVKEVFADTDNFGVVKRTLWNGDAIDVTMADGKTHKVELDYDMLEQITRRGKEPDYNGLSSMVAYDLDKDGKDELLTTQSIVADKKILADVGAVWKLQELDGKEQWKTGKYTIMLASSGKNNSINDGVDAEVYCVLPRKLVLPGGEATYPMVAYKNNPQLQNEVNALIIKEVEPYLAKFYRGEADVAFNVAVTSPYLLSLQLISGKNNFVHHNVHLDVGTGKLVKIEDILDTSQKDLYKLLNLLNNNKNLDFSEGLPREWYIKEDKIFFLENVCGKEEVSGFALGNLHKFIKEQQWISKKSD
ncbi:MAG: hypothetical protein IJX10_02830 [Phascolarctobacterium sp.]|nr:hypothetical protein [Phascolarctobacterium sp.]